MKSAQQFYEENATNVVNVPRPGHPEDPTGWAGVRRASEARFIAKDALVMTLQDAWEFAEKYHRIESEPAGQGGWVAVGERLPKPERGRGQWVGAICVNIHGVVFEGVWDSMRKRWSRESSEDAAGEVTHWMPPPSPPASEAAEEEKS